MAYRRKFAKFRRRIAAHPHRFLAERYITEALRFYKKRRPSPLLYRVLTDAFAVPNVVPDVSFFAEVASRAQEVRPLDHSEFVEFAPQTALLMLEDGGDPARLELFLSALRTLDTMDFSAFLTAHSRLESVLQTNTKGVFGASQKSTQQLYRDAVSREAAKRGTSELLAANLLGKQVSPTVKHPRAAKIYLLCFAALLLCGGFLSFWWSQSVLLTILLILPFSEAARRLLDTLFARLIRATPLPRLTLTEVPSHAKTLVVITTLLTGKAADREAISRLERFYLANREKNVMFGLLLDFPEADTEYMDGDEMLYRPLLAELAVLRKKYEGQFALFLRHRTPAPTEGRFMGYERKRGAILELVRLIFGKPTSFFVADCDKNFLHDISYLLTLDADTDLGLCAVRELVATALHPENRPIVANGRVIHGYGIYQPRMEVSPWAAAKTRFSMFTSGGGGISAYASAAFETWQTLCGEGSFCGKGLIDVSCYASLADTVFPDGQILSHDLLEGGVLRCAYVSDLVLTDSTPTHAVAWFRRLHRWMRGDMQSLWFAGRRFRDVYGRKIRTPISPCTRLKLWENLRRMLVPIFSVAALVTGIFAGHNAAICALFSVVLPSVLPLLFRVLVAPQFAARRFFASVLPSVWQALALLYFDLASLLHLATLTLGGIFRVLYRRLWSGKKLLEWVTADAAEYTHGNFCKTCFLATLPSTLVGLLLVFFVPYGGYRLLGLLFCSLFFFFYYTSKNLVCDIYLSVDNKRILKKYVRDSFGYYERFVTKKEHYLPPDNFQETPVARVAHRTSPTNIGLYLLSLLAARDFSLIDNKTLFARVSATLTTIEALPTWHGHLYNWYDTRTLDVLGAPYVSTVDSGNFVTALVALAEGLREYGASDDLTTRIATCIKQADFGVLIQKSRGLFAIGCHTEPEVLDQNCYDLLMSESRTTSYFAIASGQVPRTHWGQLGRFLVAKNGNIGLAAWTGTMFEFFMPALLLHAPQNTMQTESLAFALARQMQVRAQGIWGQSESGYFYFDALQNYQYRAFGVQDVAIKPHMDNDLVFAPYATFLTLPYAPEAACANLAHFAAKGMYGKYGFYEAIDLTPARVGAGYAIVRSYMAHHVGMSIVAAANATFNYVFAKRFFQNPQMAAARELLAERVDTDAPVCKRYPSELPFPVVANAPIEQRTPNGLAILSNGNALAICGKDGGTTFWHGERLLTKNGLWEADRRAGFCVAFSANGVAHAATDVVPESTDTHLVFCKNHGTVRSKCVIFLSGDAPVFVFHLSAEGAFSSFCPLFCFTPILTDERAYHAHPAFSGLSLVASYDKDAGILFYKRRSRTGEQDAWLGVSFASGGAFSFLTNRNALPLAYTATDILALTEQTFDNATGACIDPFCAVKKESGNLGGKYACDFLMASGESAREVRGILLRTRAYRQKALHAACKASLSPVTASLFAGAKLCGADGRFVRPLLSAIYGKKQDNQATLSAYSPIGDLWQYGISGDLPYLVFFLENSVLANMHPLDGLLSARAFLALAGVRFDFVLVTADNGAYGSPIFTAVSERIAARDETLLCGKSGGIFLLTAPVTPRLMASAAFVGTLDADTNIDTLLAALCAAQPQKPAEVVTKIAEPFTEMPHNADGHVVYGGAFCKDGFTIYKGLQQAPWSYLYADESFGTLLTQNTLGCTFGKNAERERLSRRCGDIRCDFDGERLFYQTAQATYDLCAVSNLVTFFHGYAQYSGNVEGVSFFVSVGIDAARAVKLILVRGIPSDRLSFALIPDGAAVQQIEENGTSVWRDYTSEACAEKFVYLHRKNCDDGVLFLLGLAEDMASCEAVCTAYPDFAAAESAFRHYATEAEARLGRYRLESDCPAMDVMFNYYLPYQALYQRLFARTGLYQTGGAYGFRDQLQDALCALPIAPELTKRQILLAAAHQYPEGDVMHWWHAVPRDEGVRTRCSDDLLWLPFALSELAKQEDCTTFLGTEVPFLDSPPLASTETDRYETPQTTTHVASLYEHCMRAIKLVAARRGPHGLPHIGDGDWNDGLSHLGRDGRGESVWLALFFLLVARRFLPICEAMHDETSAARLSADISAMERAVERYGYDNGRYLRGYNDAGSPIGGTADDNRIFLLPQAFAVLARGKSDQTVSALREAWERLYDPKYGLLALFAPNYDKPDYFPGYLCGYAPGLRENGGQYTHGAMFALWALFAADMETEAFTLLFAQNPALRCRDKDAAERYRLEPYLLAGDIYTAEGHVGQGGWSGYTGAAAWYWRLLLGEVLGFREVPGGFTLSPRTAERLPRFKLTICRDDTTYVVSVTQGEHASKRMDGKRAPQVYSFDKKEHFIEIIVAKAEKKV